MKIALTLIVAVSIFSGPVHARETCVSPATQFCLEIVRTFHKPVFFSVDKRDGQNTLFVQIYSGQGGYEWGDVETRYVLDLNTEQVVELDRLLTAAMNFPRHEQGMGFDGSMWYLYVFRYGYDLRVSFWSPQSDTEKRQLSEFVDLGTYLWEISKVSTYDTGRLY